MTTESDPIARLLTDAGHTLAVAESLTGGCLSSRFAQRPGASEWYRGAIVAYGSAVKHEVLGVRPGPVVSREAALDMAHGVAERLGASVSIAVTGVGGPGEQDNVPPGTVWVAVEVDGAAIAVRLQLEGGPDEIVHRTCEQAAELLEQQLREV